MYLITSLGPARIATPKSAGVSEAEFTSTGLSIVKDEPAEGEKAKVKASLLTIIVFENWLPLVTLKNIEAGLPAERVGGATVRTGVIR
jgi:hypothetical protein